MSLWLLPALLIAAALFSSNTQHYNKNVAAFEYKGPSVLSTNNITTAIKSVKEITTQSSRLKQTCMDKECVQLAAHFLSNMDQTVNPCDDFYKFACGNYQAQNRIPADKIEVSEISKISDVLQNQVQTILEEPIKENETPSFMKLKKFYNACINLEKIEMVGLTEVKNILVKLDGWSMPRTWEEIIYGIQKTGLDTDYLLTVRADMDYKNSSIRILAVETANFPLRAETLKLGKNNKIIDAYYTYMVDLAKLIHGDSDGIEKDMDEVLDFEIALAMAAKSIQEIKENISAAYNLYTVEQLETDFPDFPWLKYLNAFTPDGITVERNLTVILTEPKYTMAVIDLLKNTPQRTIINYIVWRALYDMSHYLSKDVKDLQQKFFAAVIGQSQRQPRAKECIEIMQASFVPILGSLYIRKYFDPKSKEVAKELVKYLKDEFRNVVNSTNWLDEDKTIGIEKVDVMNEHIAFPDELLDDAKLESVFGELDIDEDNFLKSVLTIKKFNRDLKLSRLHEPVNKTDWIDHAQTAVVNAYYEVETNSIIFPAAILQGVFFNAKRPRYANFAAIGSVIGHEITHGFDDVGHQLDKDGNLNNWWSETAEEDFLEKKECLTKQFDGYSVNGQQLNGDLTVGENLADFGGQKISYLSYKTWVSRNQEEPSLPGLNYTIDQLFWIAGASIWCNNEKPESLAFKITTNTHSPNEFRVNGPLSNIEMFAKDFNCPLGSNMNPEKKCMPW